MLYIFVPTVRFLMLVCSTALVLEVVPLQPVEMTMDWFRGLLPLLPPVSFAVLCLAIQLCDSTCSTIFRIKGPPKCNCYLLMGILAMASLAAELVLMERRARFNSVIFHKYMCIRFLLEACDGISAHRPCGCCLAVLQNACRMWALSWRFLRDLFLGLCMWLLCLVFIAVPCFGRCHQVFLFRALPKEEARAKLLEESLGHTPRTPEELMRHFLADPLSMSQTFMAGETSSELAESRHSAPGGVGSRSNSSSVASSSHTHQS